MILLLILNSFEWCICHLQCITGRGGFHGDEHCYWKPEMQSLGAGSGKLRERRGGMEMWMDAEEKRNLWGKEYLRWEIVRSGEGEFWSLIQAPTEGFLNSALLFVMRGSDTQGCCEDHRKATSGTFLVVQWLRIYLPMQETWIQSLVQEDPTCRVPQLLSLCSRTRDAQLLNSRVATTEAHACAPLWSA